MGSCDGCASSNDVGTTVRRLAILNGIIETAKANGLEPYAYLRNLFERLAQAKTVADFEALLPLNASEQ